MLVAPFIVYAVPTPVAFVEHLHGLHRVDLSSAPTRSCSCSPTTRSKTNRSSSGTRRRWRSARPSTARARRGVHARVDGGTIPVHLLQALHTLAEYVPRVRLGTSRRRSRSTARSSSNAIASSCKRYDVIGYWTMDLAFRARELADGPPSSPSCARTPQVALGRRAAGLVHRKMEGADPEEDARRDRRHETDDDDGHERANLTTIIEVLITWGDQVLDVIVLAQCCSAAVHPTAYPSSSSSSSATFAKRCSSHVLCSATARLPRCSAARPEAARGRCSDRVRRQDFGQVRCERQLCFHPLDRGRRPIDSASGRSSACARQPEARSTAQYVSLSWSILSITYTFVSVSVRHRQKRGPSA